MLSYCLKPSHAIESMVPFPPTVIMYASPSNLPPLIKKWAGKAYKFLLNLN
jgi:hypothetical protein